MRLLLLLLLIACVLGSSFCSAELEITEIMFNPSKEMGSDSDLEWVEIYNNDNKEFDLTNFTINQKKIDPIKVPANSYLVIAKELIDGSDKDNDSFSNFYDNVNAVDAQSFSLSNTKGTITISNGNYEVAVYYEDDFADGNGYSLELINGTWTESKKLYGTPGRENTGSLIKSISIQPMKQIELDVYLGDTIYTNLMYDDLFKVKFKNKDCAEKHFVKIDYYLTKNKTKIYQNQFTRENIGCSSYSNTGELTLTEAGEFQLCGKIVGSDFVENINSEYVCKKIKSIDVSKIPCEVFISVLVENNFYQDGEKISFYNKVNDKTYPFSIEYWVEDLFGNVIKDKVVTTNTNKKSYTPRIEEEDRVLLLKAKVNPLCKDYNLSNNYIEKMLIITNPKIEEQQSISGDEDSTIEIKKITPSETTFGDVVKAEVEIYKGSTGKYSLSAYIEKSDQKISEVTKINLKDKHTNYKVNLPIQVYPNCNLKIKEGKAKLIVSGLGTEESESIELAGVDKKLCKDYLAYVKETEKDLTSSGSKEKFSYSFVDLPKKIKSGDQFDLSVKFISDNSDHEIETWAYLYRGSKCYSCNSGTEERNVNLIKFDLDSGKDKTVKLPLTVDSNLDSGDYKIKLKIVKDNQKTVKELTTNVEIETIEVKKTIEASQSVFTVSDGQETGLPNSQGYSSSGIVVYEDSSQKAQKLLPYILLIVFGLICIVLFRKK